MPTYNPKAIEPRWQQYWLENKTFRAEEQADKPKYYILDMFPYPSGAGLHVGHPEGYTATDILARYKRMRGFNVLHPMGWDAFGLPAEQYAIETGTHPRLTTQRNVATFRRQIQMLGFTYDWDREVDTTDPKYFQWTQWIFLELFDTWYDAEQKKGRPIGELPIPSDIRAQGPDAVQTYQDNKRLAYQAEVPVNWCPALGTVLANEEVVDGKSERGGHPVLRMPLRQWLLRITDYAERLLEDLSLVDWPESIKKMQRDWIGRSEGAEVDFALQNSQSTIRVFTTRPDTLFGATYMVLAPEHPLVDQITTVAQRQAVEQYKQEAARKSDLERTELAKKKTGVFTGAFALNPVNGEKIPIWIADYVLISYGTGAIMAVPGHDERDFEFALQFKLPIRPVVLPPRSWLEKTKVWGTLRQMENEQDYLSGNPDPKAETLDKQEYEILLYSQQLYNKMGKDPHRVAELLYRSHVELFRECFVDEGTAINSGPFDGLSTAEFKQKITAWLEERGLGKRKVNYKLRDWLFSRQRYWGEPFPILHELDSSGKPSGRVVPLSQDELPLELPQMDDYKPSGQPEPPLGKARSWVQVTRKGQQYLRETNTMPQWAGSCWYYLRYLDAKNSQAFCDPAREKYWMPVDLYVGGAEHAVLHLLYSRFWHKVLFDRGHVHTPEPFTRLVNQGMILGEMEFTGFVRPNRWRPADAKETGGWFFDLKNQTFDWKNNPREKATTRVPSREFFQENHWVSASGLDVETGLDEKTGTKMDRVHLDSDQIEKQGDGWVLKDNLKVRVDGRAYKMSKARGNVINPDQVVDEYGADSLRLYEMFMGPLEATKPWSMRGVEGVYRFLNRVWRLAIDERSETVRLADKIKDDSSKNPVANAPGSDDRETLRMQHQTIKRVTEDLESMSFNTAIAAMMELVNHLTKQEVCPRAVLETLVILLSPFAPHLAEEIWRALGHDHTLAYEPWPTFEEGFLKVDEIEVPVQINGKLRSKLMVGAETDKTELERLALADEKIKTLIQGKTVRKVIVVPGKLVNLVVS